MGSSFFMIKARCLDSSLFEFLAIPRKGKVHRIHRRAFSIDCPGGPLVSALPEGLLPCSLLLPEDDFRQFPFAPDQKVSLDRSSIAIGDFSISLEGSEVVPPPPLHPSFEEERLRRNLAEFEKYVAAFGRFEGFELIRSRVEKRDYQKLVGVGLGLTPSGDDFLVGLLLALFAWERAGIRIPLRETLPPQLILDGTTRESQHFLSMALFDRFSHGWIRLIDDLFSSESFTIEETRLLMKRGATSGTDLAMGLLHGLKQQLGFKEKGEP